MSSLGYEENEPIQRIHVVECSVYILLEYGWECVAMQAPEPILDVWRQFADVPAESLTYQWWRRTAAGSALQRSVALMEEHHAQYGSGGDAFDLAIWLLAKFHEAGILADPVAPPPDVDPDKTSDAIAVVAKDRFGRRYFCDLGEQWIQPILVSTRNPDFTPEFLSGFDPGAEVSIEVVEKRCTITRRIRVDERTGANRHDPYVYERRVFDLRGIPPEELIERAENAARRRRTQPWLRRLIYREDGGWGVWCWTPQGACWRLPSGVVEEPMDMAGGNAELWVDAIATRSGLAPEIVVGALAEWAGTSAEGALR